MTPTLTARLVATAEALGIDGCGVVTDSRSGHHPAFVDWIAGGNHGSMEYLSREDTVRRRRDLTESFPEFRSAVVVAQAYGGQADDFAHDPSVAVVARYARGRDYHRALAERLRGLGEWLADEVPGSSHRAYVDTGPILERELGRLAGLGWFGRNTMLIHPRRGSYFFLGVLLTDVDLDPSAPMEEDHCGTCRSCLDACPTGALLGRDQAGAPVMDARRCISYLTIENRGAIPLEFRSAMGNRVFGCDICQEVCPWSEKFGPLQEPQPEYHAAAWAADRPGDEALPSLEGPDLVALTERLLAMSGKAYQRVFAESPLSRPGRKGMLRNLCVALGNYARTSDAAADRARPVLERASQDPSELVREHALWALEACRD